MAFYKKYPHLADFLGAWFVDIEISGSSEKDVVKQYSEVTPIDEYSIVLKEAELLCLQKKLPFSELGDEVNVNFQSSDQARTWLEKIIVYMKKFS